MEPNGQVGFYVLHNTRTDQAYAGSGILKDRQKSHEQLLRNGKHYNHRLQHAYDKDPNFKFVAVPVEGFGSYEENRLAAFQLEQEIISEHWGNPLFLNLAKDVEACFAGKAHTDESKQKSSRSAQQLWQDPVYRDKVKQAQRDGWASLSEEDRVAFSAQRSQIQLARYADGSSSPTLGQTRSVEFREHNSAMIKQKWQDPAYREKQCAKRVGNTNTPTRPVSIEGVTYPSITAAAQALGIGKEKAHYRIQSTSSQFESWAYLS